MKTSGWIWLVLVAGIAKVLAGLGGILFAEPATDPDASPLPLWTSVVQTAAFASAGAFLLFANRRDRRAFFLGGSFLLTATTFSDRLLRLCVPQGEAASVWAALDAAETDAFLPAFLWLFCRSFPDSRVSFRAKRLEGMGLSLSIAAGVALFSANLVAASQLLAGSADARDPFSLLLRSGSGVSLYYPVLLGLSLAALVLVLAKARTAGPTERRRVRLFLAGLFVGLAPVSLDVLAEAAVPGLYPAVTASAFEVPYRLALQLCILSLPLTTTYSVVVDRVLDVRLVVRQTLQYALARYSVMAVAMLPFAGLLWYLFEHRQQTLSQLFAGPQALFYLAVFAGGLVVLRLRHRVLDGIDRRFFREQYDARRILSGLLTEIRKARSVRDLVELLVLEIDRALHIESIAMLVKDTSGRRLEPVAGSLRPLQPTSPLAALIGGSAEPLDVDLDQPRSALRRLPDAQKEWLADAGAHLIVPISADDGSLLGLIALGEKKSELPFHAADRALLCAVAGSTALALESRRFLDSTLSGPADGSGDDDTVTQPQELSDEPAHECGSCGRLYAPQDTACEDCGGELRGSLVPAVLHGKFRLEQRVGRGGMGIVYRASDLILNRTVAVKTLPRIHPESARRLRSEARAAAAITHPNLATIFGAETWRGIPMLIFEFLEGGTLADRLRHGTLPPQETVLLGLTLAEVLDAVHEAGVLHGDVKPSNIGYAMDGTPKLLDFGVARVLRRTRAHGDLLPGAGPRTPAAQGRSMRPGGTMAYLSPEALRGDPPEPSFDLWSAAVVLWQSLTGRNPFAGGSVSETVERIERAELPDLRQVRPECGADLALFFHEALARERSRRPSNAREFGSLLSKAGAGL